MKSAITKRSISINGHKTSVSLEDQFWSALRAIASARALTVSELIDNINQDRIEGSNLSSALRCFVLAQYRSVPVSVGATP